MRLQLLINEEKRAAGGAKEIALELLRLGFAIHAVGRAAVTVEGAPALVDALLRRAASIGVLSAELQRQAGSHTALSAEADAETLNGIAEVLSSIESVDQPPQHQLH